MLVVRGHKKACDIKGHSIAVSPGRPREEEWDPRKRSSVVNKGTSEAVTELNGTKTSRTGQMRNLPAATAAQEWNSNLCRNKEREIK